MAKDKPSTDLEARLRARFAQLGINVEPERDIIERPDPTSYVGVRQEDEPNPYPGSKPYPCAHCGKPTWFAPSGQAIIEGRKVLGNPTTILCLVCLTNQQKS